LQQTVVDPEERLAVDQFKQITEKRLNKNILRQQKAQEAKNQGAIKQDLKEEYAHLKED